MDELKRKGREGLKSRVSDGSSTEAELSLGSLSLQEQLQQYTKPSGVGVIYDDRMLAHNCIWVPSYPEKPERLSAAIDRCRHYGLLERCVSIPARLATEAEILRCHSAELFNVIKNCAKMSDDELRPLSMKYDAVFLHQATYEAAMLAAGSTVEIIDRVVKAEVRHGLALVRPPGHHAMYNEPCGYCMFNNVAIGVRHALDVLGLERVLVVDWDIHHGQGTQYAFYTDPRVLYFSVHRYEYGTFWPNLRQSDYDFIGEHGTSGRGYNVNVPINKVGLTNSDFLAIIQQILMPLAFEFDPQLVIVSAGYDAVIGDPEGRNVITPAVYAHLTHMMKQLAGGKLAVVFEGGYCIKSLAESVALTLRCLLDDPCPDLGPLSPPLSSTVESILHVLRVLRPFWKCFAFQANAPTNSQIPAIFRNVQIPKSGVEFPTEANRPESFSLEEFERMSESEEKVWDAEIDKLIGATRLDVPANRTCIIYDERMSEHRPVNQPGHLEDPARIKRIFSMLEEYGLVSRCRQLPSRAATKDEIALIHSLEYIERVESFESLTNEQLAAAEQNFKSIYLSQATYHAALLSTGCALNAVDEVLTGKSLNGFAVIRPPGHHAEKNYPTGFCIFNNVAIAAKYAQQKYNIRRVLILDWDIHHGNGTQSAFESDPSVLYVSIHRQDIFPPGDGSVVKRLGRGPGEGFNVNIPWLKGGMGDAEYLAVFQQIVMPVAYEFGPELVLVSAGFDAALGDPLGVCKVSPAGYSHMTHMLSSLAGGKMILVLEGGYNLNAISESAAACLSVLLGDRVPPLLLNKPLRGSALQTVSYTQHIHRRYWKSLAYHVFMPSRRDTLLWLCDNLHSLPVRAAELLKQETLNVETTDDITRALNTVSITDTGTPHSVVVDTVTKATVAAVDMTTSDAAGAVGGSGSVTCGSPKKTLLSQMQQISQEAHTSSLDFHAVVPLPYCPHLEFIEPVPSDGINATAPCLLCRQTGENWVCLTCYQVFCSRYVNGHMEEHWNDCAHSLVLSLADISVWCYTCNAYVHNDLLTTAKQAAYWDKFGEQMAGI